MLDVLVIVLQHDFFQVGASHLLAPGFHPQLLAEVPGDIPVFFGALLPPHGVVFNLFPRYPLVSIVIYLGVLAAETRTDGPLVHTGSTFIFRFSVSHRSVLQYRNPPGSFVRPPGISLVLADGLIFEILKDHMN